MVLFRFQKKSSVVRSVWKRKRVSRKHVSISRKKHVSVMTEAGNGNTLRFRFQEKNCLSVVNSANNPPKQSRSIDPWRSFAGQLTRRSTIPY